MTTTDLAADTTLDEQIASQVFRWQWVPAIDDEDKLPGWEDSARVFQTTRLPRWSTKIAHAWDLVIEMKSRGWSFDLSDRWYSLDDPNGQWGATFSRGELVARECAAYAQKAIALAALEAVALEASKP